MPILNKNKFEMDQKSFAPSDKPVKANSDKGFISEFLSNPTNKVLIAVVAVFVVILLGGFIMRLKNGNSEPAASQPAVSVSKHTETEIPDETSESEASDPDTSETTENSETTESSVSETDQTTAAVTEAAPSEIVLDRAAINNEIFKTQSAIADATGQELVLYPIAHTENPKIPVMDISQLPAGQIVGYKDSDTLYIALNDGSGTITVNLAGINCTPPGGATGALAVSNWFNEIVTEAEPPYTAPGSNYVYIEYASEAPTMSDGSYNAYIWLSSSFCDGETVCLNEWMLQEAWAEPDPNTANKKYYEYFKVYPYTYQDVQ